MCVRMCVYMHMGVCMNYVHVPCKLGCPTVIRCDYGTKNCLLATTQMALHHGHGDTWAGLKSFKYGKSTSNTVRSNDVTALLSVI